jgi:D-alanyl-D-alanine carboxypeptidase
MGNAGIKPIPLNLPQGNSAMFGKQHRSCTVRCLMVVLTVALASRPCSASTTTASSSSDAVMLASLRADVTNYLRTRGAAEHVSAALVSVSLRGRRANITVGAGTTRYGGRTAVPPNSLWQIGSNTKAFTAATVLELEAEHKLSIRDTVGEWLPQYPAWRNITIKQLLNMTSDIVTYDEQPAFLTAYAADPTTEFSKARLVSFAGGKRVPTGYYYSNTGYILAQMIIEKATNDTYAHQLTKRFIIPLGLRDLFYSTDYYSPAITARMPSGYFFDDSVHQFAPLMGRDVRYLNLSWAQCAGGIVASPEALTKWARALYEGRVLAPPQQNELESLVSLRSGRPITMPTTRDPEGFGLGIARAKSPTFGTYWYYEGGTFGYRVLHMYLPRSGTVIAFALNSGPRTDKVSELARSVYATLRAAGRI